MITICGIIGYSNDHTTSNDLKVLRQVLIESRIRGKHASGIAWYDGGQICCLTNPIPIDELLASIDLFKLVYDKSKVSLIAHARYSTSDIAFNQPIANEYLAIAHNGVITQSDPSNWESDYGYQCQGRNDSELILKAIENHDDPLKKFPTSSIAAVALDNHGKVTCMRNALRPLWKGMIGHGVVYASTYSILERAGVKCIEKIPCQGYDWERRDWTTWKK